MTPKKRQAGRQATNSLSPLLRVSKEHIPQKIKRNNEKDKKEKFDSQSLHYAQRRVWSWGYLHLSYRGCPTAWHSRTCSRRKEKNRLFSFVRGIARKVKDTKTLRGTQVPKRQKKHKQPLFLSLSLSKKVSIPASREENSTACVYGPSNTKSPRMLQPSKPDDETLLHTSTLREKILL